MGVAGNFLCEKCGGHNLIVKDSRGSAHKPNLIRRRRECVDCGHRMTFVEMPAKDFKSKDKFIRDAAEAIRTIVNAVEVIKELESEE